MSSLSDSIGSGQKIVSSASSDTTGGLNFGDVSATIITKFIEVTEAVIILIIVYFITIYIRSYFNKIETAHDQQRTAINLLEKITVGFTVIIGITLALKVVGIDMSVIVGVGLLGLSYGMRDIIKNYIAGILIFLKAPFKIGDVVKIKNFVGKVDKMEFQSTSLKTFDHRDITIYNSDIMTQSIENYSRHPMKRMDIDVKLGYGTNIEKATLLFDKILNNEPNILKNPKYSIVFKEFADNSIVIKLKFWVSVPNNYLEIKSNIAWQINKSFDESMLFSPYNRSFQATEDFSMNDSRKQKIQEFYANPLFADAAQSPAVSPNTTQPAVEIVQIDMDEPSIEEDY